MGYPKEDPHPRIGVVDHDERFSAGLQNPLNFFNSPVEFWGVVKDTIGVNNIEGSVS